MCPVVTRLFLSPFMDPSEVFHGLTGTLEKSQAEKRGPTHMGYKKHICFTMRLRMK